MMGALSGPFPASSQSSLQPMAFFSHCTTKAEQMPSAFCRSVCALGVGIGLPCPGLGSCLQVSLWPGMEPDSGSREGKGSTAVEWLPLLHSGSWSAAPEPTGQHSSYINANFITMSSAANLWVSHPVKDSQLSGPNCPHHNPSN